MRDARVDISNSDDCKVEDVEENDPQKVAISCDFLHIPLDFFMLLNAQRIKKYSNLYVYK